jgi:hypothetical protein
MRCVVVGLLLTGWLCTVSPARPEAPPKGAQYTIYCGRVEGEAHVERATKVKSDLVRTSGMNGWYVIHDERQSLLYYGYYRAINDLNEKKESARAQADLKKIKSISADGSRLFTGAIFVDLQSPDPVAPAEWNLLNAPGAWSLQIAAYKDSPQRKEAAVEAVREARRQGIEAYFYHGDTISSVCIGVWPTEAVQINAHSKDRIGAMDSVLVQPAGMPDLAGVRGEEDVKVVKEKIVILDQTLLDAMKKYPYHAVNGMQTFQRVNGNEVPDPSLLIQVPAPKAQSPGLAGGTGPSGGAPVEPEATPAPKPRPAPATPGLGKLKSVDG